MPLLPLIDVYKLEKAHKVGDTQTVFLKEKNGNKHMVIKGIPADVDLTGNVELHTRHTEQKLKDAENVETEARPDKIEFYKVDDEGNIIPNSGIGLSIKKDGTYRHRTTAEVRKNDEMNATIISILIGAKQNS